MGLAYGAADEPGIRGYAKRIGIIIGPTGEVIEFVPNADCADFPIQSLEKIP